MDPLTIAAIAGKGIQAGHQLYSSYTQKKKAKELEKTLKRPTYTPPTAARESLGIARDQALDPRMAGQSRMEDAARGNAGAYLQSVVQSGAGSNAILGAAGGSQRNLDEALGGINQMAATQQERDQRNLQGELGRYAQYQDQQWDYNERQPYEEGAAAQSALTEASNRNLSGGIGAFAGLASAASGLIPGQTGTSENPVANVTSPQPSMPVNAGASVPIQLGQQEPAFKPKSYLPGQEKFELSKNMMMRANIPRPELFTPVKTNTPSGLPSPGQLYNPYEQQQIAKYKEEPVIPLYGGTDNPFQYK